LTYYNLSSTIKSKGHFFMNFVTKIFLAVGLAVLFIVPVSSVQAQNAGLANGSLYRAQGDLKVYYIDNGVRRYVDSPETFRVQGFPPVVTDVPSANLFAHPEGEIITKDSSLTFPGEMDVLPDIAPFAARDIQLVNRSGRQLLLFTTIFWNRGKGPLELIATGNESANNIETGQRIVLPNGSVRNKIVGNLFWHDIHDHFHYDDFASYVLEMVAPTGQTSPFVAGSVAPEIRAKSTFCIYETESIGLQAEGPKSPRKNYSTCGKFKQGISVGWGDKYNYTLPDQNFDVTGLPAGVYKLSFILDPLRQFIERSQSNNTGVAFVDLNPAAGTMTVMASGSPFASSENRFPNGMLVRSETGTATYVVQNNKKQFLKTPPSGYVFALPQGVFDYIPSLSLIKAIGSPTVYLLNENGFRRGITSMEAFNSYGLNLLDVVEISPAELSNYPETDLIRIQGGSTVYSLTSRRSVGTFESLSALGLNPASVHNVNPTDFEMYMVEVAATGLFVPWDVVFLPDGDTLVPERSGTLRRLGKNPGVMTVPAVQDGGEGGLMGVALHPSFAQNNLIYVYFTTNQNGQKNRVARFKLNGNELTEQVNIIDNIPSAIYHDGGRIAFGPDGMLYITTGDANNANLAQNLSSLAGKTLRLTPDGQVPADNPFGTAVWSYGHRNSQGIAWDHLGRMWQTEHGRSGATTGFDELNLIEKGGNYGWPVIQGNDTRAGMITPVFNSGANETWAPAGITFAHSSLFFGGLLGSSLYQARIEPNGNVAGIQTHLKGKFGRLRAVVAHPDGSLYVSTSNRDGRGTVRAGDDKILKIYPGFFQR
jgi:glucose/arabinose dehydrogenase